MTVAELIQYLETIKADGNGDKEVKFITDYGDYCHTQQALDVAGGCQGDGWGEVSIERTGYSQSGYEAVAGGNCIGIVLSGGHLPEPDDEDEEE